ncbi:MAG: hypothetical protein EXR53_04405 [Dehalococcoidia bacterium]|nr:hypothetical protein [Dehalococcoidia bacterium]
MAVFEKPPTPEWTEEYLILDLLHKNGSLTTAKLWEFVHDNQRSAMKTIFGSADRVHSRRNFYYWLRSLDHEGLIDREEGMASITGYGRWLADANKDEFLVRNNFLSTWVCHACSGRERAVLTAPAMGTFATSKNRVSVDAECPSCHTTFSHHPLPQKMDGLGFAQFYNNAVGDLSRILPVTAEPVAF